MKSIQIALSAALLGMLPTAVFADDIIPCSELPPETLASGIAENGFECELEMPTEPDDIPQVYNPGDSRYLSVDGKTPTEFIYNNKGGYVSWVTIDYHAADEHGRDRYILLQSPHLTVGRKWTHDIPADAYDVCMRANYAMIASAPGTIMEANSIHDYKNLYIRNNNSEYVLRLDVWGTIFNPKYKFVQAPGTYKHNHGELAH